MLSSLQRPGSVLFPKTVFEICCCKATTRTSEGADILVLFRFFLLIDGLHPLIFYALCLLPMWTAQKVTFPMVFGAMPCLPTVSGERTRERVFA